MLIGAIPPLMLKTAGNPGGLPIEVFDQIRAAVLADRSQFFEDLSVPFYGANRPGAKVSQGLRDSFWLQGMQAGLKGVYDCIKAFSETDQTADLEAFDVPTLVLHGDDDQVVPIGASAMLSSKQIKNARLKVYRGAPHGLCSTHKDEVNADLSSSSGPERSRITGRTLKGHSEGAQRRGKYGESTHGQGRAGHGRIARHRGGHREAAGRRRGCRMSGRSNRLTRW